MWSREKRVYHEYASTNLTFLSPRYHVFSFLVHGCCRRIEDHTSHCYHDTKDAVATYDTARPNPTQSYDSDGLGVSYHCAGYRACSSDDCKLREVEETCAETTLFGISWLH
jgi:hypothetical protein